jgi:hypothetical protein
MTHTDSRQNAAAPTIIWTPSPRQRLLLAVPDTVDECFFGGARGGGKTDGVLGEFASHAQEAAEHAVALMVRRSVTQLSETIERSKAIYGRLPGAVYSEVKRQWTMANGARLRFAYLERDSDADQYQGHGYTRVYVEEIGTFPSDKPILKLMATLRSGAGIKARMISTGNPGGPGHQWVKARYIDPAPHGMKIFTDPDTQLRRLFIPSRVTDNPHLGPEYVQKLRASGSEALVRAWLDGDWSVIEGAYFPEFAIDRHVVAPFAVPVDWSRYISLDWGSASPFSVGWWAVVNDHFTTTDGHTLPRGCLVRYREWYGSSRPNVGLKLTAEEVTAGILDRQANDPKIIATIADPSIWAVTSGPSIAERMMSAGLRNLTKAENRRVPGGLGAMSGWDALRSRLVGDGDGNPLLVMFSTCRDLIRTLPALQHDQDRPEDVDSEQEDHAPDKCRYMCMARPFARAAGVDSRGRRPVRLIGVGKHNQSILNDWKPIEPRGDYSRYYFGSKI